METIYFSSCPELINPNLQMKDIKRIIKEKKGIKEENQRFKIIFDDNFGQRNNELYFWQYLKINIYDISKYRTSLERNVYKKEIILDLNKKIGELKNMVFQQTKIPVERQLFFYDKEKLENNWIFTEEERDIFKKKISIKISKQLNDKIYIKYPNLETKEITTDLYSTGIELLKQINNYTKDITSESEINYNIYYKEKILPLDDLLIHSIKKEDLITLNNRNTIKIIIKTIFGKQWYFNVDPNDTIRLLKIFIQLREGYPSSQIRFLLSGKYAEDDKTVAEYNLKNGSVLQLLLKLTG